MVPPAYSLTALWPAPIVTPLTARVALACPLALTVEQGRRSGEAAARD